MKDRFNLEDEISTLYSFVQQLDTLNEGILEHDMSRDNISNVICGIKVMLELHAEKMQDTMCQCFKLDSYKHSPNFATQYHE
jgi:hypothetical protein